MGVDAAEERLACKLVCLTAAIQTALTAPYPMPPLTTDNTPAPSKIPPVPLLFLSTASTSTATAASVLSVL